MKMKTTGMMAAVSLCALAGVAQAQETLQFDVNQMAVAVKDGGGSASGFGGLTHTGSIEFSYDAAFTIMANILTAPGPGGPFTAHGAQALADVGGSVILTGGAVTGGSFMFELTNGDKYEADIKSGSGMVQFASTPGGFSIDGLTFDGMFTDFNSDGMFGTVDITPWLAAQPLPGSFLEFNFSPDPITGLGYSDVDVYVLVPLPPAAYAGFGMLAGVMGLSYVMRRR